MLWLFSGSVGPGRCCQRCNTPTVRWICSPSSQLLGQLSLNHLVQFRPLCSWLGTDSQEQQSLHRVMMVGWE